MFENFKKTESLETTAYSELLDDMHVVAVDGDLINNSTSLILSLQGNPWRY